MNNLVKVSNCLKIHFLALKKICLPSIAFEMNHIEKNAFDIFEYYIFKKKTIIFER